MLGPVERLKRNRKIDLCSGRGVICVFKEAEDLPVSRTQEPLTGPNN